MTTQVIAIGSLKNFHAYDDGAIPKGAVFSAPITVGTPVDSTDALQLAGLGGLVPYAISVSAIDNPTELGAYTGDASSLLLAYEIGAGINRGTLYVWDSTVGGGANSPYVVAGATGYWIAICGVYTNSLTISGDLKLAIDGDALILGTGSDTSILYDGTDLWIDPAVVGTGSVKIGDGTNYTEIQDDGTITLHGTARKKFEILIDAVSTSLGASAPTLTTRPIGASGSVEIPVLSFSNTVQQDTRFKVHIPGNIDDTVEVEFHLMWIPGVSWTTGNYMWKADVLVVSDGSDTTVGTPTTISADITPANATDRIETHFATTIPVSGEQVVYVYFYRDVANDNADDVGEVEFLELNYTINK
jgi:hypothetical protein